MKIAHIIFYMCIAFNIAYKPLSGEEGRLLRYPDIYQNQVVFVYGGDLWTVSLEDGLARKITSHIGQEFLPKFSPDGKWIAFSAEYDGNLDVLYGSSTILVCKSID